MPNPKDFKNKDDFMGACMSERKKEGKTPHDQNVAICLSMWRRKNEEVDLLDEIDEYIDEDE